MDTMKLYIYIAIFILMESYQPACVTSQTSQPICCPRQFQHSGTRVHCAGKNLASFHWSGRTRLNMNVERTEICTQMEERRTNPDHPEALSDKVTVLDLSRNALASFPELSHPSLNALRHLNLSHNVIQDVGDGDLSSYQTLETLDLSFNRLSSVPDLSVRRFPRLLFLDLSYNSLQVLSRIALRGLSRLKTLNMSHNQLDELIPDSFVDLTSLGTLQLSFNRLEKLPVGVFDELGQLETLELNNNLLASVPKLLFQSLSELKHMTLSHNSLTEIFHGTLRYLSSLHSLDLSHNELHISGSIFEGLSNLGHLGLAGNKLKAISRETFKGLDDLHHLDLSSNLLTTIRKASFTTLHKLWWLSMKSNKLKRLPEHLFAGLKWLNFLDLSHNELQLDQETFPPDLFSPLANLYELHLENNDDRAEGKYPPQLFESLEQLRHLTMDTFETARFGLEFSKLSRLRTLHLPNCKLKSLTKDSFRGFRDSSLRALRLDGCPLISIEGCAFCGLKNLERLTVTNRSPQSIADTPVLKTQGRLIGPENTILRQINVSNMHFHSDIVQALADYTLKNLDRLEVLDLSANNLHGINVTLKGRITHLFLSGNRLQSVPVDLSHLKHLSVVDISDNNIKSLTLSERASLDELARTRNITLWLRGNQLKCSQSSCEDADFLRWLCTTKVTLDDGETTGCNYTCVTEEGKITNVEEMLNKCSSWQSALSSAGTLGIVILVCCSWYAVMWTKSRSGINRKEELDISNGNAILPHKESNGLPELPSDFHPLDGDDDTSSKIGSASRQHSSQFSASEGNVVLRNRRMPNARRKRPKSPERPGHPKMPRSANNFLREHDQHHQTVSKMCADNSWERDYHVTAAAAERVLPPSYSEVCPEMLPSRKSPLPDSSVSSTTTT